MIDYRVDTVRTTEAGRIRRPGEKGRNPKCVKDLLLNCAIPMARETQSGIGRLDVRRRA